MGSFPGSVFPFVSHKVVGSYAHNSGGNRFSLPLSDCPDTNCRYFFDVVFLTQVEAVDLISDGKAPKIPQPEEGATYDKIWKKKEVAKVGTLN